VKICVIPELGGRLFYAVDKTNDYDLFYRQHVIKPALIGMLGAWISGGVEWNFPHHHRASGFMMVDYSLEENPDGSKTIWIGEIEIRHRMKWMIGLTLYPDKSYIEASARLFNRTPFAHSFLYWANIAVHTNPDYQVIFPPGTEYATFHGKNQFSRWPISYEVFNRVDYTKGVDVSWWKNHPAPTSFFAWNYKEDFLAGYDHGKEAGVVHVANHHLMPGKKFWTWGTGPKGQMWEKILTDADGPYLELMVGAYSDNQPDYSWIQPYEVKTFKHAWFPLRQIKGVKKANLEAALNLEASEDNRVFMGLNTTKEHKGAMVILKSGDEVIFNQTIDISPEEPFGKEIDAPSSVQEEDFQLFLLSSTGKELISYSPRKKEKSQMPETVKPPPSPEDIKTVEELYLTGLRLEQFYSPALEPYPYYEEALRRDPGDYRANTALGVLYCKRGLYKEAEKRLRCAVQRVTRNHTSPKDGEATYYLGVVLKAQGKKEAAYDAFSKAVWSQTWRSAGYFSLAELACRKGDFQKALDFLNRSHFANTLNTKVLDLKAAVLRRLGRTKEAQCLASGVLAVDPLDFWAGNELYLAKSSFGLKKEAKEDLKALRIKMRDSVQSYLELAADYSNCGLFNEAIEVLSRLTDSKRAEAQTSPMLYYWLGFLQARKAEKEKSLEYLKLASKMPSDYCFPFRLESIPVLRWAEKRNPNDAKASYYLGNLLFDIQSEEAIRKWEKSRKLDSTLAVVHRNLGLAYARVENDVLKAVASLEKAVACNREDPRLFYELDLLYESGGVSPQKRLEVLQKNHNTVLQRDDALSREIALLVQVGRYKKAIDILETHHFHVWEGGGRIHDVYVDAHLFRGQEHFKAARYKEALDDYEAALDYPENLEVGKPFRGGRASQIYYFMGTAWEALGEAKKAQEYFEKSVSTKHRWSEICYYQGLAFQKLSREDEANQLFEGLIRFGKEGLRTSPSLDFFTKFGERESAGIRRANAHYLLGLGYLGKGRKAEAKEEFEKALRLNVNHFKAKKQLSAL
jgi:tetratricopeptide (TPR) repeat protein